MVRERSPSRTSIGHPLSTNSQKQPPARQPLANISAKMQSPGPDPDRSSSNDKSKATTGVEFGKASPLRNPLRGGQKKTSPSIFVPKQQPKQSIRPTYAPSRVPSGTSFDVGPPKTFKVPGHSTLKSSAHDILSQHYQDDDDDFSAIYKPSNPPSRTVHPPPKPTFSSKAEASFYQAPPAKKPVVDLTTNDSKESDEEDDENERFDPDAIIRAESRGFGAPDPYSYLDADQANENIKNLLEGAFDDEGDKGKSRLRSRIRKVQKETKTTKSFANKLAALSVQDKESETAEADDNEEEDDGTVEGLTVKLLPHQVEGVSWMVDKEIGAKKTRGVLPHGGILADDMGLGKTVQSVTLMLVNPRPALDAKPEHRGQKLPPKEVSKATLVIAPLALIKQWESEIKSKVTKSHALKVLVHHGSSRTKSPEQLKKYDVVITTYSTLTSEHAGSNMLVSGGTRIGCMGVHWYRIILDEAHSIKNRNAKSTQACYALSSWYRWCLTGTPMQNNLDELQSLIKFLQIKPYNELNSWREQVIQPMKNGRGGIAMRRLQIFLAAFMKRRTKDILKKEGALNFGGKADAEGADQNGSMKIVKREVLTVECELDEAEQEFYDRLQARADKRLQQMAEADKADYMGALVLLLRLRQACNHPQLVERAITKDRDAMTTGVPGPVDTRTSGKNSSKVGDDEMDGLASLMGGVSVQNKTCDVCQVKLSSKEIKNGAMRCSDCEGDLMAVKSRKKEQRKMRRAEGAKVKAGERRQRNRRVIDDSDDEEDAEGGGESLDTIDSERSDDDDSEVVDSPSRAKQRERTSTESDSEDAETNEDEEEEDSAESDSEADLLDGMAFSGKAKQAPSSKIRHLLRILHKESPRHKTIVFSQFTTMLDLIEPHLKANQTRFVRYDGSMRPDEREQSLNSLRTDPNTRVLLCSLKCGSLGLNLTAASRVVIVEPFWNPFVEEQAIDRVHRLNQTVDVKVFRLTVPNSVEERIIDLQERKRELANAAIEGTSGANKLSMKDILGLFKRDAEHTSHDEKDREMWQKFGGDNHVLSGPTLNDAGDMLSQQGFMRRPMPGTPKRMHVEHDVYGRRW